jgi:hypothetical protein
MHSDFLHVHDLMHSHFVESGAALAMAIVVALAVAGLIIAGTLMSTADTQPLAEVLLGG